MILALALSAVQAIVTVRPTDDGRALCNLVDSFFGTGGSTAAVSEGMARGWNWEKAQTGNTHPGAVVPFGWVSVCGYSGGYSSGYGRFGCSGSGAPPEKLKDLKLFGFTHFHHNGAGWIGRFLNYCLFTPHQVDADTVCASAVRDEKASPGFYAAELVDYGAAFEVTAGRFVAYHRYRFPKGAGCVRVDFAAAGYRKDIFGGRDSYCEAVTDFVVTQAVDNVWSGHLVACGRPRYFALIASNVTSTEVVSNGVVELAFADGTKEASSVLGFSDVSAAEASSRARIAAGRGFDAIRAGARAEWENALGGIRAEFADPAEKKRLYSALFHSFQKPVEYRPGRFAEFSTTWDIYRAQLPLVFSFARATARPLALSLLETSEELGYFPNTYLLSKRPSHNDNQATALGVYVLADACFRGLIRPDEYPRVKAFFEREFKDANISRRSVTHILDVAGAYRAAAFVAEQFGDAASAADWLSASAIWKRAYDSATGLLPKSANFYEGDERNYSFRPHVGMTDRVALAGGTKRFEALLDDFFAVNADFSKWTPENDRARRPGHFEGLNNECDMNAPLAWFWAGRADRVCEVHDLVRRCRFSDGPGALPGNNDGGGTSAWYVWSCLGLSPLSGTPYVFLVSPTVVRAHLALAGGNDLEIEVERTSPKAIYPKEIVFNGVRVSEPWLTVSALQKGGRLLFRMTDSPTISSPVPTGL